MVKRYMAICLLIMIVLFNSCTTLSKTNALEEPEATVVDDVTSSTETASEFDQERIEVVTEEEPKVIEPVEEPAITEPVEEPTPELVIEEQPEEEILPVEPILEIPVLPPQNIIEAIEANDLLLAEKFILLDSSVTTLTDEQGNTPLHLAASLAQPNMIQLLLKHGAELSTQNSYGRLPIHTAAALSFELAHLLLGNGSLLYIPDDTGVTVLDMAFSSGPTAVSALLGEQFVNSLDMKGNSPLHFAAQRGELNIVRELIEYGADINITNSDQMSPLDVAFSFIDSDIHVQIARLLIENYSQIPQDTNFYYAYQTLSSDVNIRFEGGTTPLHFAALYHHPALLRTFIAEHAYLEARDEQEDTPLHIAVIHNYFDIMRLLVDAGADVDARDTRNNTPLHLAVTNNTDQLIADYLLKKGAEVDSKNSFGETPLHSAMPATIDTGFVSLLLSYGADPDSRNTSGNIPIMAALAQDNKTAVDLLLDKGTDIYASNYHSINPLIRALIKGTETISWFYRPYMNQTSDGEGNSPLHIAVMVDATTEVIEQIITAEASLDERNLQGETPLHLAVGYDYPEAAGLLTVSGANPFINNNRGKSPIVLAFDKGIEFTSFIINEANLQGNDSEGNSPLHLAALWDFPEITSFLISSGAAVNARNTQGLTPMHYAVKNNSVAVCRILHEHGAGIDARDNYGNTPLHTAISWGSSQSAKLLLLLGANVELRNLSGNTPLHTAALHQDSLGINMLHEYGASLETRDNTGMTPLLLSSRKNYWTISQLLIELGADYNTRDDRGNTPLHEAVRNKNKKTCQLLSDKGADIYAENSYGDTPLMIAFKSGVEIVDWFITGPMVFDRDDEGNTPLHTAIRLNTSADVILSLIEKGADINSRNNKINTPLHNAFLANNKSAVMVLVEAGADLFSRNGDSETPLTMAFTQGLDALSWVINSENVNTTDQYGNTALHAAATFGSLEAIEFMLNLGADPNLTNLSGDSPAEVALKNGQLEIMNRLRVFELD